MKKLSLVFLSIAHIALCMEKEMAQMQTTAELQAMAIQKEISFCEVIFGLSDYLEENAEKKIEFYPYAYSANAHQKFTISWVEAEAFIDQYEQEGNKLLTLSGSEQEKKVCVNTVDGLRALQQLRVAEFFKCNEQYLLKKDCINWIKENRAKLKQAIKDRNINAILELHQNHELWGIWKNSNKDRCVLSPLLADFSERYKDSLTCLTCIIN